jgi:hypothetical protein
VPNDPILIIAYNKPDLLSESLARVRELSEGKIYVHIDGPQEDTRSQDLFFECQSIVNKASLRNPQIISKVREVNLGGQFGVLEAIDWFFENETFGIILEEDIGFGDGIFKFVSRYRSEVTENKRFALCFFNPGIDLDQDFVLSHWLPWGWATNAENWLTISREVRSPEVTVKNAFPGCPSSRFAVRHYLNSIIKKVKRGKMKTWDAQVHATLLNRRFSCVFPAKSLTKHLGIRPEATHADLVDWWQHIVISEYAGGKLIGLDDSNNKEFEKLWRMSRRALLSNTLHGLMSKFRGKK